MEANELDSLRHAGFDRILQTGGVGEHRDAVGLERDRLVQTGEPRCWTAFAVDDRDVPSELRARFLDVDAIEMGNVVLLVAGQEDDLLAGLGLRRLGRPVPGCLGPSIFGDRGLGVRYGVGQGWRDGKHPSKRDDAREHGKVADFNFHGAFLPFFEFAPSPNWIGFGLPALRRNLNE